MRRRSRACPEIRARRRRQRWVGLLILALLLTAPTTSYVQALTYPGAASFQVRSVEWLRDHGLSAVVDAVENYVFSRNAPDPHSQPIEARAQDAARAPALAIPVANTPAALPPLPGVSPIGGEGSWVPDPHTAGGQPVLFTSFFRPDPAHPTVVVGVASFDQTGTQAHLVAGTRQPGGTGWPEGYQVPRSWRSQLVAAFNSGFKIRDAHGGYYADGRVGARLVEGAASLVIDTSGHVQIGQWGRDLRMNASVAAVRQNLALVVDGGRAVPGLDSNAGQHWGSARSQFQYTWRSAIGTDQQGNLIYLAGRGLTLQTLADAMVRAGIQRGMELDIHPEMVAFNLFAQVPGSTTLTAHRLLESMPTSADRYLSPDQRDFIAITTASTAP